MGCLRKGAGLAALLLAALLCSGSGVTRQETPNRASTTDSSKVAESHSARIGEATPALETGLAVLIGGALVILLLARNGLGKLESEDLP